MDSKFIEIKKIYYKKSDEVPVYDITVKKNHNFILNDSNAVVHNCDLQQQLMAEGFNMSVVSVDRVDPSSRVCLIGDSLIDTPNGFKKLKDILPGDFIYSWDVDKQEKVIDIVQNWYHTDDVNELYEIETEEGVIKCTAEHLILTSKGYVKAKDLTESDLIKSIKKVKVENEPVYDISVLKNPNFVLSNSLVVHNCRPYQFFKNVIYEQRVDMYESPVMIEEIVNLERNINTGKVDHPEGGCFTGDTKVRLLDGSSKSFVDLVSDYENGKTNWVYSVNLKTKKIEPQKIINARKTKENQQLVEITLDNRDKVRCTYDHKFMLRNGSYIEASDLLPGDSLMPLYIKYPKDGRLKNYRLYYEPFENKWHYEHRSFANKILDKKYLVHHKLYPVVDKDEFKTLFGFDYDSIDLYHRAPWTNRYRQKKHEILNHKVISIKYITEREDVYDIEVDKNHNFALDCGVFVHNSKDVTDAFCGAMFTASKYAEEYAYNYGESYDLLLGSNTENNMTNSAFKEQRQMMVDFEEQLKSLDPVKETMDKQKTKEEDINQVMIINDTLIW